MAEVKNQQVFFARQGVKHTAVDTEVVVRPYHALKITTITTETDFEDSVRAGGSGDADDFWNDYFLIAINCTNVPAGEARLVTDFANSDGGVTIVSTFSASLVVGDIFAFLKFVNANSITFDADLNRVVRNTLGQGLDPSVPITIPQGSTASIEAHVTGPSSYPAAGTPVKMPPQGDLYRAAMGAAFLGNPTEVDATSGDAAQIDITTATHERSVFGACVMVEDINASGIIRDEARWVVGKDDGGGLADTLHVKPNFTAIPATASKRVYGSSTFGLVDLDHPKVSLEFMRPDTTTDGEAVIIQNALMNLNIGAEVSNLLIATFDIVGGDLTVEAMPASHFSRTIDTIAMDEEPSFGPVQAINGEFSFRTAPSASSTGATYSGTLRDIIGFAFNLGVAIARKRTFNSTSGVASTRVSAREPVVSLNAYLEGAFSDFADLKNVVIKDFQIQLGGDLESGGNLARNIFVLRVPFAAISARSVGDEDGLITLDLDMSGAKDKSEGFEDGDVGTVTHNPIKIADPVRFAIF